MDKNPLITKGLALAIVVLFIGTILIPGSDGDVEQKSEITQVNEPRSAPSSITDWWPMFHHDLYHSGHSNSTAPETNTVLWTYSTNYWLESSPAVADGKVYIGSQDYKVYCLDALTGAKIWTFPTGHLIVSSPAVYDGKVYIGSTDHLVYCLNADSGSYIWIYPTGWGIAQSSPVVVNGKVYIGSQDNKMYCLDAETGSKIWDYTTDDWISSSPAVADGKVYFGSWDKKIYCLNADNGSKIWDYSTGDIIWTSSPTIFSGKVYIGSLDCIVYCLNAMTGMKLWNYTTGDWVTCTPAVANGNVFVGSWDGKIYCLNATTGMMIWYYLTGGGVSSSPAVTDGKVYVGSHDNKMYCLDAMTGMRIWDYVAGGQILSSPAIAEGNVYVGSMDNKVYCFGSENLLPVADFTWTPSTPNPGQTITFNASSSYDPDGYILLYEWDWNNDGIYDESHVSSTATYSWSNGGNYSVTLRVTDNNGATGTQTKTVKVNSGNQPPEIPSINGPAKGKVGVATEYNFTTTDPDRDQVYYFIDWGDTTNSSWVGPYPSGDLIIESHTWSKKGIYTIKAKAKDIYGNESAWTTLKVSMPLSNNIPTPSFREWLFERFPHAFPILRQLLGH